MKHELYTYKFTCDYCKECTILHEVGKYDYPSNWYRVKIYDCGLTGYTTEYDCCNKCYIKLPEDIKKHSRKG